MDAATATRAASAVSSSNQLHRKKWRAVAQDHPDKSDERTIYEVQEGAGPLVADYCSITIDDGGEDGMLQERLQEIGRQQQELHHMEVELRARAIARSGILEVQNGYEARIKEHAGAASKLEEQLQEREQQMRELEMELEDKERELRAVKIDNEAAWAKEDLLREQNKELASFRRERDNSEAERAQHLQKIHELQEHIQEKESRFLVLEEQHRVAQETILLKDEQLREAQSWIARVQEMDVLHSTTNQSLQAELRERTEQFNQYWIGLQRQFAEMERHHLQAIQQLQLELAEARERNGIYKDGSQVPRENSIDGSSYVQNNGSQISVKGGAASNGNSGFIYNGNLDNAASSVSASSASTKTEHTSGVPVVPSSILGMGAFMQPSQMTAVHPFVMHPQAVPPSVSPTNPPYSQSHMGHFHPVSSTSVQHWPNEQTVPDVSQVSNHQVTKQSTYQPSQPEQNLLRSDAQYSYQNSAERQVVHPDHLNSSINQRQVSGPIINNASEGVQVLESNGNQYEVSQESQEAVNANIQFPVSSGYEPQKLKSDKAQEENLVPAINQPREQVSKSSQQLAASSVAPSAAESHPVSSINVPECNNNTLVSGLSIPGKVVEPTLLDERSLLACIVRAIPAGSDRRIRISSTLPNRLGKMLAPLHWHDYKKYYGKLDDFVAHHPELFVIQGDFIHLREGAQEIISATTAYAKVAAAAASSAPYSSLLPSVAVTPVAQNSRQKKAPSTDLKPATIVVPTEDRDMVNPVDSHDRRKQISKLHSQQSNGVGFNVVQGLTDLNVSSKSKDVQELNGLSETGSSHSSVHKASVNGANLDRAAMAPSQNNGLSNGRHGYGGRQQGRSSGAGLISRRQN